jgi:hypothetical protein
MVEKLSEACGQLDAPPEARLPGNGPLLFLSRHWSRKNWLRWANCHFGGENATAVTEFEWPASVFSTCPVVTSHTLTVLPSDPSQNGSHQKTRGPSETGCHPKMAVRKQKPFQNGHQKTGVIRNREPFQNGSWWPDHRNVWYELLTHIPM